MANNMIELNLTAAERVSIYNFVSSQEALSVDDLSRVFDIQKAMDTNSVKQEDIVDPTRQCVCLSSGDFRWFFDRFKGFKRFKGEAAELVIPLLGALNRAEEEWKTRESNGSHSLPGSRSRLVESSAVST